MNTEPELLNKSIVHRTRWLINLRWMAATGVLITIAVSRYALKLPLPYHLLLIAICTLFLYNFLFHLYNKKLWKMKQDVVKWHRNSRIFTNVQITLDLILLAFFIHLSGGPESPLIFYFIFHMVIASIILSNRAAYLQSTFSAIIFGYVVFGESSGFLEHYHIGFLLHNEVCILGIPHNLITYGAIVSTLYITTYFTTSIVNELRKGETELEKVNRELEEKDKLKSKYVKTVTHDLRSSLSTVQSCLKVVLSGLTGSISKKSRDMIGRAEGRTRKLTHFVEELWSLSRMRVIEYFEKKNFSILKAFESARARMELFLEERDIILKIEDRADNPQVHVNDFLIEELFINLLDNAIVYSPKGSTVTVALEKTTPAGFVQVSIQDEGIGIPEKDLSQVFEDFYRSENAKEVYKDGTGLGLSIVKQIIDMHGGNIWVKSRLNRGATVIFTLPGEQ